MRTAFDHQIKSEIEKLEEVPGIVFEEERTWKRIMGILHKDSNDMSTGTVVLTALVLAGLFAGYLFETTTVHTNMDGLEKHEKVKTYQNGVVLDTKAKVSTPDILERKTIGSLKNPSRQRKETMKIVALKALPVTTEDQQDTKRHTVPELTIPNVKTGLEKLQTATVHIYRPNRYVGSGLVFRLKANGILIDRVKNGRYSTIQLKSVPTQFLIGKQKLYIPLKPNQTYYLRVRYQGFPIGKPIIEWIAEDVAKKELFKNTVKKKLL